MRTAKSILIAAFLLAFVFNSSFQAVTLDPADYTPVANETKTFTVIAEPPAEGMLGVQLRLQVENATIIDFVPVTGEELLLIPTCADSAYFTATQVCTDFTTSTTLVSGQVLGTLTVQFDDSTLGKITKTEENAYLDANLEYVYDNGTLVGQTETVTTPTPDSEASTQSALNTIMAVLLITIGLVLISVAIVLVAKHTKTKNETQQNN